MAQVTAVLLGSPVYDGQQEEAGKDTGGKEAGRALPSAAASVLGTE